MNVRNFSRLFFGVFLALALLGNKNGRAASQGSGNTGAPGDETNANGTPKTCVNCHNVGPITATVGVTLLETDGDTVTSYAPNTNYILRVKVNGTGTTIQGYGFQMIPLKNSNNTDIKGMSDFGGSTANNYKIATIQNGRTYAEHSNISAKDTFNVRWKSPVAGTGTITIYASGNAVNGNNGTGGDGAAFTTLVLNESSVSSADEQNLVRNGLQLFPNPVRHNANIQFDLRAAGQYQIQLFDLNGAVVWSSNMELGSGQQQINIPMAHQSAGIYLAQITNGQQSASVKVLKI
jgi:Secretion system C-terminal sorting domain